MYLINKSAVLSMLETHPTSLLIHASFVYLVCQGHVQRVSTDRERVGRK
jgi:hypothetical protein